MDLHSLNRDFASLWAPERIARARDLFGPDLILTTTFGRTAGVMLKMASEIAPGIRVINIRHGYETTRTLELAEEFTRRLKLNLKVVEAPRLPIPEEGTPAFEAFKHAIKVETFERMLADEKPKAWLSGVMREETPERRTLDYVTDRGALLAVYPILDWTEIDAREYCLAHGLPMNEDYYDPCKGRSQKTECSLHIGKIGESWMSSGL
jgi:phosphoadenosine phosphosulfate reductase